MMNMPIPPAQTIKDLLDLLSLLQIVKDPKKAESFWKQAGDERAALDARAAEVAVQEGMVRTSREAVDAVLADAQAHIDAIKRDRQSAAAELESAAKAAAEADALTQALHEREAMLNVREQEIDARARQESVRIKTAEDLLGGYEDRLKARELALVAREEAAQATQAELDAKIAGFKKLMGA